MDIITHIFIATTEYGLLFVDEYHGEYGWGLYMVENDGYMYCYSCGTIQPTFEAALKEYYG